MGCRSKSKSPQLLFETLMTEQEPSTAVYEAAATANVSTKFWRRHAFSLPSTFQSPACLPLSESSLCPSSPSNNFIMNALYYSFFVWISWSGFRFPDWMLTYTLTPSSVTGSIVLVFIGLSALRTDLTNFCSLGYCLSSPTQRQGLREEGLVSGCLTSVSQHLE